uniref:ZP domain-containing protein n=1 Tax=Denticeps clupeoides TaxID=299321 RepID=A0AAY4B1Z9_9TELE
YMNKELFFFFFAFCFYSAKSGHIQIECGKDFMSVKWMVDEELSAHPNRLFLGLCYPSQFTALPGGGQAVFNFSFHDCHIRPASVSQITYQAELTYRPHARPQPPVQSYSVACVVERGTDVWIPLFLQPAYGKIQANSNLNFHMGLLNEDLSGPAESNTFAVGSFIPIWASVEQQFHQPLLLLLEECVASTSLALMPGAPVYPIITNMGCLVDGKGRGSRFLPRHQTYAILLYLQAFEFAAGKDIYIHCKLMAWDPAALDFGKKACNYNNQSESWEMLDDPSRNSLCSCCDSNCVYRTKRGAASGGLVQNAVLGPLVITTSEASLPAIS